MALRSLAAGKLMRRGFLRGRAAAVSSSSPSAAGAGAATVTRLLQPVRLLSYEARPQSIFKQFRGRQWYRTILDEEVKRRMMINIVRRVGIASAACAGVIAPLVWATAAGSSAKTTEDGSDDDGGANKAGGSRGGRRRRKDVVDDFFSFLFVLFLVIVLLAVIADVTREGRRRLCDGRNKGRRGEVEEEEEEGAENEKVKVTSIWRSYVRPGGSM